MYNPESFVKYKDLPNFTSIFGNLGQSWNNPLPNDLYIKGVPKVIFSGGNFAGNNGTGLDTVLTFPFPARSIRANGDIFRATLGLGFASNDDDKRIQISFGIPAAETVLINTGVADFDSRGCHIDLVAHRLSSTQVNISVGMVAGAIAVTSGSVVTSTGARTDAMNFNVQTVNNMDTLINNLLLQVESATATNNNIIWNVGLIELTRF